MTVLSACRLTCFQSPGDSFPHLQLKPASPAFLSCHCYQKADVDAATQGTAKRALDLQTPKSLPLPERGNEWEAGLLSLSQRISKWHASHSFFNPPSPAGCDHRPRLGPTHPLSSFPSCIWDGHQIYKAPAQVRRQEGSAARV